MKCRHAEISDLKSICSLLADEFYDDPVLRFAFTDTGREQRLSRLEGFFRIYFNLALEYGGILLAENDVGVLVYFRPELMEINEEEHQQVNCLLQQECGSDYDKVISLMNGLENSHPHTDPHFYVFLIAVRSSCRRKGVATALLAALNMMLDREEMGCYAECTTLTTQYLFGQLGYGEISPPLMIEGFPSLYPVWREPAVLAPASADLDTVLLI
ncbi:GNAT family N-acetyltransferase [Pantoea sp. At-9b]|uniref:GNAT family N-acetyltransferase n=1 Tax=Pantoea sp. (strain At-9b) TaxID=592316 RepID=UPI0001B3E153|nr:GNAT family N-acetyltransferase [Pantoea sp. At-9b]ADU71887.1 hypothetical protein Pat9b_5731 [Pantoea sp. At-9b]